MFKKIKLTAEQAQRPNAPNEVYKNSEFLVQIFNLNKEPTDD